MTLIIDIAVDSKPPMINPVDQINERSHAKRKRALPIFVFIVLVLAIFGVWKSDFAHSLMGSGSATPAALSESASTGSRKNHEKVGVSDVATADIKTSKDPNPPSTERAELNSTPEICGLTSSEAKAFTASKNRSGVTAANRGMAEVISRLVKSNNVREKTLGLFVTTIQASTAAADAERLNTPGCTANQPCFIKPFEVQMQVRSANAEPLVRLALSNGDVSTYAAALYACGSVKSGACTTLSYLHWAEMEPDNAAPWLMAAGEADIRKDNAALINALKRAANAKNYDERIPPLASILSSDLVQSQTPLEQSIIATELKNIGSIVGFQKIAGTLSYCAPAGILEEGRRAMCDALAAKLAEKDETTSGALIASKIGEKLGWSAERLQPLKDELDISVGQNFVTEIDSNKYTCENLVKFNQASQSSLALGLRAANREFVKKSGSSLAEVAAKYRKAMQF